MGTQPDMKHRTQRCRVDTARIRDDLKAARDKAGLTSSEPWGIGEALFYGEAVTSTQTLLDK